MSACSACGAEHRAGQRFCGERGAPLALTCTACGSVWGAPVAREDDAEREQPVHAWRGATRWLAGLEAPMGVAA